MISSDIINDMSADNKSLEKVIGGVSGTKKHIQIFPPISKSLQKDSQEVNRSSFASNQSKDPNDPENIKKLTQHKLHLLRQLLQKHKHQALLELMDRQAKEIEVTAKQIQSL